MEFVHNAMHFGQFCITMPGRCILAANRANQNILRCMGKVEHYPIFFLREQLQDSLEDYMPYRVLSQFGKVDAIVADSIRVMSRMVEADMGVAISTDGIFIQDIASQGITKPLRDNIYGYFGYLIHEDDLNNPLVTDFLDILHQTVPLDN